MNIIFLCLSLLFFLAAECNLSEDKASQLDTFSRSDCRNGQGLPDNVDRVVWVLKKRWKHQEIDKSDFK